MCAVAALRPFSAHGPPGAGAAREQEDLHFAHTHTRAHCARTAVSPAAVRATRYGNRSSRQRGTPAPQTAARACSWGLRSPGDSPVP